MVVLQTGCDANPMSLPWYHHSDVNNYICGGGDCKGGAGSPTYHRNMNGTVSWLKENRFEYLKVDSGGCYNDMQLWHDLLADANYPMMTENCHQGGEPPNASWCPFDLWRVGGDVNGMVRCLITLASSAFRGIRNVRM